MVLAREPPRVEGDFGDDSGTFCFTRSNAPTQSWWRMLKNDWMTLALVVLSSVFISSSASTEAPYAFIFPLPEAARGWRSGRSCCHLGIPSEGCG